MFTRVGGYGLVLTLLCAALPVQAESVREILERRGVIGTWAIDCDQPVSQKNDYTVYRAVDAERVQRDAMASPTNRITVGIVESVVELSPNELQMTVPLLYVAKNTRHLFVTRVRYEGRLSRVIDAMYDGKVVAVNGRHASDFPDRALRNKPTDWVTKCN